jgi:hypothetical protein
MSKVVLSIQGTNVPIEYIRCRAFRHAIDEENGSLFQEQRDGRTVWVAPLECPRCGTRRTDVMTPRACELISRTYDHPDGYDGLLTPAEARRILYKHKLAQAR